MRRGRSKVYDCAVVGVVTAILLTGLVVAVISLVQTMFVPRIMEQREAEHMDKVAEQFAYLTSVIDGQAAERTNNIPIATSITLGSKELPYLLSVRAFGTLEILPNMWSIGIVNGSQSENNMTSFFQIGSIKYSSANAYFLDQTFVYEAGAMIVGQNQGNLMMVRPAFYAVYDSEKNKVNISFDVINISSIGGKTSAAGFGTYPIQTEFDRISTDILFSNVQNITFTSVYSNAWKVFINRTLIREGLNVGGYGEHFSLNDAGLDIILNFSSSNTPPVVNVHFRVIDIQAQIGPGWIE